MGPHQTPAPQGDRILIVLIATPPDLPKRLLKQASCTLYRGVVAAGVACDSTAPKACVAAGWRAHRLPRNAGGMRGDLLPCGSAPLPPTDRAKQSSATHGLLRREPLGGTWASVSGHEDPPVGRWRLEPPDRDRKASGRPVGTTDRKEQIMNRLECVAGIDGGSQSPHVGLVDQEGNRRGARAFPHRGAGLVERIDGLLPTTHAAPPVSGVALDGPHGPGVEPLRERGVTGHALQPKPLDRCRDRGSPAGAKDDRREAWTRAEAWRPEGPACRRLAPSAPAPVDRREGSRRADDLTRDPSRIVNRACQPLWRDAPPVLHVDRELTCDWGRELWRVAPRPDQARRLRPRAVGPRAHRVHAT